MTKKKEQAVEPKLIRIEAKSQLYSVSEVVPENKCIPILKKIKENFINMNQKHNNGVKDNLLVTTSVYNPTLF